jgi:hypothetical protein
MCCVRLLEGGEMSSPKSCEMEIFHRGPMLLLGIDDDVLEYTVQKLITKLSRRN